MTGLMRTLLFLAVLGVVSAGIQLDPANPAASAFEAAAGDCGLRIFGLILWSAAITSVIGASYTRFRLCRFGERQWSDFAMRSSSAFIATRRWFSCSPGAAPVPLLIFAGAFNGLILPLGVGALLWVALRRRDLMDGYR